MTAPACGIAPDLVHGSEAIAERGGGLGRPLRLLVSTTSTNDEAKQAARRGAPHGATWVAETQTAGRGRQGRVWLSAPGENLLFSVLLRESLGPSRLPQMALVAGLAVRDAIAGAAPDAEVTIKWPNDVLVATKKIAGVLVEAISVGSRVEAVVVGVGINVHTRAFPAEIAYRATSVALVAPATHPPDRASLLADALMRLDRDLLAVATGGLGRVRARIEAVDALRGHRVRSDAGDEGIASGIDDTGRLLVRRDDGVVEQWVAGEVHLLGDER